MNIIKMCKLRKVCTKEYLKFIYEKEKVRKMNHFLIQFMDDLMKNNVFFIKYKLDIKNYIFNCDPIIIIYVMEDIKNSDSKKIIIWKLYKMFLIENNQRKNIKSYKLFFDIEFRKIQPNQNLKMVRLW